MQCKYILLMGGLVGETGVVYKGILMNWKDEPLQAVAVKTLKGNLINLIWLPYVARQ